MSTSTFVFDPSRPVLRVNETRMNRLMSHDPLSCATISEYASRTGIPTDEIIELFEPAMAAGHISMEVWGDELFVHTAPRGRSAEIDSPQVAPNLWELLRQAPVEHAYALWRLVRGLEEAGWAVESNPHRILFGLGPLRARPYLGVGVRNTVVPVVVLPTSDQLSDPRGTLSDYDEAGAAAVAVVIADGSLDAMATAVRQWMLSRQVPTSMQILLLEDPRYNPVLIGAADAAVRPRAMSRVMVNEPNWSLPGQQRPDGSIAPDGYLSH
jgi:hypothetical protein